MVSLDLSITHFTGFSECLQPTNRRWSGQSHENLSCGNLDWHFHRQWEGEAFPCVPCLCWSSSQTSSLQLLYVCLFCHAPDICRHHYCVWIVALGVTRWAPTVTLDKTNIKFSQAQIKGGMDDKEWEMGCGVRGGRGMVRLGWKHPDRSFLERGVPGEIGHGLSALSSGARIYAWEKSVAEFPCSLGCLQVQIHQEFNICYLDILFWITICKHTLHIKPSPV